MSFFSWLRVPRPFLLSALFGGVCLLLACGGPAADPSLSKIVELEDTRTADAATFAALLAADDVQVRTLAARAAGRLRSSKLTTLLLDRLNSETDPGVRSEVIFALGQIRDPASVQPLMTFAPGASADERAQALHALSKIDAPDASGEDAARPQAPVSSSLIIQALEDDDVGVQREALLALVRLHGRRVPNPAGLGAEVLARCDKLLDSDDAEVRWAAAYALSEVPFEMDAATGSPQVSDERAKARARALKDALKSPDDWVRLFALRGLERLGRDYSQQHVASLLTDLNPAVATSAVAATAALGERIEWILMRAASFSVTPDRFHVRAAAIERLGDFSSETGRGVNLPSHLEILDMLHAGLADPSPTVRAAALIAMAKRKPAGLPQQAANWSSSEDPLERMTLARAAGHLEANKALPILEPLLADADVRVSAAALGSLGRLEGAKERAHQAALEALRRDDLAVRGTALGLLGESGTVEDLDAVRGLFEQAAGPDNAELRVEAIKLITKLGGAGAESFLQAAVADTSPAVSKAAREALKALGKPAPEPSVDHRPSSVAIVPGQDLASDAPLPRAVLETSKGEIVIELLREQAPKHVKNFIEFVKSGRYDGLSFHRVVSGFVIQGLDPRGDGWGSGGAFVRDEINPVRFERGTVGMPNAGPDTAGCQIFINHVPTPHLDGNYTVFGQVVQGLNVVDLIEVGDIVTTVRIDRP